MKTILKVALAISLLASFAMADGDGEMGSGGYQPCTINCPPPPPCTEFCEAGGGGNAAIAGDNEASFTLPAAAEFAERVIESFWFVQG